MDIRGLSSRLEQAEESANLKTGHLRLSSLRNRKKIKINGQSPVR